MPAHFIREVANLKQRILSLGAIVELQLHTAVKALHERDRDSAQTVVDRDEEVDRMEIANEEECLKVLALHQPVARDLRFIVSVLKINNDLERIGDLAANIARKAIASTKRPNFTFPFDLYAMSRRAEAMLNEALDSLVQGDGKRARHVCSMDEQVNKMKRKAKRTAIQELKEQPELADSICRMLGAVRNLERIADLATNIAEEVVYQVEGNILRHSVDSELKSDNKSKES